MTLVKVGLTRDMLNAQGEPSFGRQALAELDANPAIDWEWIPEDLTRITPEIAARYDGLYVNTPKVDRDSVGRADRRVRIIARHGVGFDAVDVPALSERGILLTNTPEAIRRPMAVAALTLVFALTGRLLTKDRLVREGRWAERTGFMGQGLTTRTLGVVGAGGIGRELMTLARPFFAAMLAADPFATAADMATLGADLVPLDDLLGRADAVVLCCPLTPGTRHLIDAAKLRLMRPQAFLINVARGPVVDEPALVQALRDGTIAGAGLDVFEAEPIDARHPLCAMDNVVLAPHALGWTDECFHAIASSGLRSIADWSLGRRPRHLVDPGAWR